MKVMREVAMKVDSIEIGDHIKVKLPGETHFATAIRKDDDGVLFYFDDCLKNTQPMNKEGGTEGGYLESDLRKALKEIEKMLPKKILKDIVPNEDGDYLYLLSMTEVCGCDENFDDCEGQIPWFKEDWKRRIATRENSYEWYWLRDVVSAASFASVYGTGSCFYNYASDAYGVRPAFKIRNL